MSKGVTPIGAVSRAATAVKKINSQTVKALLGEVHDQAVGAKRRGRDFAHVQWVNS